MAQIFPTPPGGDDMPPPPSNGGPDGGGGGGPGGGDPMSSSSSPIEIHIYLYGYSALYSRSSQNAFQDLYESELELAEQQAVLSGDFMRVFSGAGTQLDSSPDISLDGSVNIAIRWITRYI
ncbi:unnamed protein product [Didymodactylos carnosus]|uniref:Uncharacterized protein n=1 Tax=Didymodactylos carnosus TaxID=1234261 RepID=A0A815YQY7_9BILA|nr:unnamed protein product [Didymodactylos carnosus]CAF1574178.1 unnamed protein product [Didymodactylos carnosus]CAF3529346.1 unnamed protein product [Didymodactylos carnosus]CAF4438573.1 unnamed protein product [Didymodactylos carnosus]